MLDRQEGGEGQRVQRHSEYMGLCTAFPWARVGVGYNPGSLGIEHRGSKQGASLKINYIICFALYLCL